MPGYFPSTSEICVSNFPATRFQFENGGCGLTLSLSVVPATLNRNGDPMVQQCRNQTILWAVIAIASLISAPSGADELADNDTKEIGGYVLTEAGLAKYMQAAKNMGEVAKQPGACDSDDGDDAPLSLDALAARIDSIPGATAAIKSAGMTPREYTVFMFSLVQNGTAAWALDQPGGKLPPGTSMANVNFYRTHAAAIQKAEKERPSSDCEDAEDAYDSEE